MFPTCHHVMPSGLRCQSPALRGYAFCYHHARRGKVQEEMRIALPAALDRTGILRTLQQVLQALADHRISPRRASILFYGLQMIVDAPSCNPAQPAPAADPCEFDRREIETETRACCSQQAGDVSIGDLRATVDSIVAQIAAGRDPRELASAYMNRVLRPAQRAR